MLSKIVSSNFGFRRLIHLSSKANGVFQVQNNESTGVTTIRLENQKKKNALSFDAMDEFGTLVRAAAKDPKCRALLWTGSGEVFCSGLDLADFAEKSGCLDKSLSPEERKRRAETMSPKVENMVGALIDFPKPLIAGVNGHAVGIGVTALALCDYVIATNKATFNAPFSHLGFVVEAASSFTFPLLLGPMITMDMLVFGRVLKAEEAVEKGLLTKVVAPNHFEHDSQKVTELAASFPKGAFAAGKERIRNCAGGMNREKLHKACREELVAISKQWASDEVYTAVSNFLNRKKK